MKDNGMADFLTNSLPKNSSHQIFSEVRPDPSQELVESASKAFLDYLPDMVIAMGGGSAIDLTKALVHNIVTNYKKQKPVFVAIPTTAGTGSEVTNFAVVTKGSDKIVIVDDLLLPDYAMLIPSLTKSVPDFITADTDMDVLTHSLEAYMIKGANVFTDTFAIKSIKLVFENLAKVYEDGKKMSSRKLMLEASCMAGIAFTNAGLGINHSLAHTIGGRFHIAHGRLNAIILPYVLEFNMNRCEECKKKARWPSKRTRLKTGKRPY